MSKLQVVKEAISESRSEFSKDEVVAMQRAVVNLFNRWSLTDDQACVLLGAIGKRTYQRWKEGEYGVVKVDLATRLSTLMGIHKALRLLFVEPQRGYEWIKKPNAVFTQKSALDVMMGGELTDLIRVRRYLDASRGN